MKIKEVLELFKQEGRIISRSAIYFKGAKHGFYKDGLFDDEEVKKWIANTSKPTDLINLVDFASKHGLKYSRLYTLKQEGKIKEKIIKPCHKTNLVYYYDEQEVLDAYNARGWR